MCEFWDDKRSTVAQMFVKCYFYVHENFCISHKMHQTYKNKIIKWKRYRNKSKSDHYCDLKIACTDIHKCGSIFGKYNNVHNFLPIAKFCLLMQQNIVYCHLQV